MIPVIHPAMPNGGDQDVSGNAHYPDINNLLCPHYSIETVLKPTIYMKYRYIFTGSHSLAQSIRQNHVDPPEYDEPLEELWINGYYTSPKEEGSTHTFYRCGNVLVMERHGDFWLGSNCELPAALNEASLSSIKRRSMKPD
ncbi:hypothetical protein [Brevibacillus sp. SIMBA_040]|uniref:hypothetical protein n=1 Tax=unclassified Brevibacillus TaxID=2684853 RepID=UPI003978C844